MSKVKICHLTVTHTATDNRIFKNQCKALFKEGYAVSYIAPNAKNEILDGINIIGVKCKMNPIMRIFDSANKVFKKAIQVDADIYHFHDIELFNCGVKLKKRGKKVIFDSHENWLMYANDIHWLPSFGRKIISRFIKGMYRKHLNCFDAVISVSPNYVAMLENYSKNVYMITNYPKFNSDEEIKFSKDEYLNRENTLFYSGTVDNQEVILNSIFDIDINYNIAGNFIINAYSKGEYRKEISKHPSWHKVKYLGFLTKKELGFAFQEPTIAITLLHYHANVDYKIGTLGNTKFFEYMKYGLPIICTDFKLWKEQIIDKYKCGICVNPDNEQEVKQAIKYLIDNKEIAYQMGQNAQKAFREEFNWNSQEQILLNIYKSLD